MNENLDTISSIGDQSAKKKGKRKFIIILIAIIFLTVVAAAAISYLSSFNDASKTGRNKAKNALLDNPIVMKAAESLPIPKITMVPVTPISVSPALMPGNAGANREGGSQEQVNDAGSIIEPDLLMTTYTNTDLSFSMDYPADYKVEENSYGLGVTQINFISPINSDPGNYPDIQLLVYPVQIGKLIGQDFDKLYALGENTTQRMSSESIDPRLFTVVKKKDVAGYRAFEFRTTDDPPDENIEAETGVYIFANDLIFIMSTGESGINLLDKMILTFKLI